MRILQINSAENFGGGEHHLIDLAHGLHENGHRVFVALSPQAGWREQLTQIPSVDLLPLPLRNSIDLLSAWQLAKFIKHEKIEIIHAHLARDYPLAAFAAYRNPAVKFILTRHLLLPLKSFHRFTLANLNRAIAVSEGVAESLRTNKIITAEKITVIYNGIDVEKYRQAAEDTEIRRRMRNEFAPPDELLIGTVGELRAHKGQEEFIRAAAIIAQKFDRAKFIIIGADNSPNKAFELHLRQLTAKLNLHKKVIFTGLRDDMPQLYAGLDVFVSAARTEPFGLVIAEAMAAARAIVATATVGANEILNDGETKCGKIVETGNAAKIAEAVSEFLAAENLRREFGATAQISAALRFNRAKMIAATEEVYRQATGAK